MRKSATKSESTDAWHSLFETTKHVESDVGPFPSISTWWTWSTAQCGVPLTLSLYLAYAHAFEGISCVNNKSQPNLINSIKISRCCDAIDMKLKIWWYIHWSLSYPEEELGPTVQGDWQWGHCDLADCLNQRYKQAGWNRIPHVGQCNFGISRLAGWITL